MADDTVWVALMTIFLAPNTSPNLGATDRCLPIPPPAPKREM